MLLWASWDAHHTLCRWRPSAHSHTRGRIVFSHTSLGRVRSPSTSRALQSGGSMAVKVWVRMQWNDLRLAWNPDDYGGLHTVKVRVRSPRFPHTSCCEAVSDSPHGPRYNPRHPPTCAVLVPPLRRT